MSFLTPLYSSLSGTYDNWNNHGPSPPGKYGRPSGATLGRHVDESNNLAVIILLPRAERAPNIAFENVILARY